MTSSRLGSSALADSDVTELSLVRTLLRSVFAPWKPVDVVSCERKLERSSSAPSHGADVAVGEGVPKLSIRLLPSVGCWSGAW